MTKYFNVGLRLILSQKLEKLTPTISSWKDGESVKDDLREIGFVHVCVCVGVGACVSAFMCVLYWNRKSSCPWNRMCAREREAYVCLFDGSYFIFVC